MTRYSLAKAAFAAFFVCIVGILLAAGLLAAQGGEQEGRTGIAVERESGLNRADPAYIQWLEKRSFLGAAEELGRVVSGSQLMWRAQSLPPEPRSMAAGAGVWFAVHPNTLALDGSATAFSTLARQDTIELMTELRVRGLYMSPLMASGALWAYTRTASMHGADAIQHDFSDAAGTPDEFMRLRRALAAARITSGTDLLPAATGLGPDFFLAARAVRMYPGVYCMIEVPRELWGQLPPAPTEWKGAELNQTQCRALAEAGVLPFGLARETTPWASKTGWATTGEVRCADGFSRRWLYIFNQTPERPVLNWDDPSAAARRILSANVVQHVGMNGFALAGLQLEPFIGLDARSRAATASGAAISGEPGVTAARTLGREVRRYGGRSLLREAYPIPVLALLLDEAAEYAMDSITSPAAEHALLTGEVRLLRAMLDEGMAAGVDFARLVHATPDQEGVSYALPHLAFMGDTPFPDPKGGPATTQRLIFQNEMRRAASAWRSAYPRPLTDVLPASGAALAALGAGFSPEEAKRLENREVIRDGHLTLLFFKAMLPGIFQFCGQDLAGTLPLPWRILSENENDWEWTQANRGAYVLNNASRGTVGVSRFGVPAAPTVYEPPTVQRFEEGSLLAGLGDIIRAREAARMGEATLIGRVLTRGRGCIAPLMRLTDGSFLLAITNFNGDASQEYMNMALVPGLEQKRDSAVLTDLFSGETLDLAKDSRLPLTVPGRGFRAVHISLDGQPPLHIAPPPKEGAAGTDAGA